MTPEEFNRRCDLYAINSRIHRTFIHGFIGFAVALGVLGGFLISAEQQLKREALEQQEARATWVK